METAPDHSEPHACLMESRSLSSSRMKTEREATVCGKGLCLRHCPGASAQPREPERCWKVGKGGQDSCCSDERPEGP